MTHLHAPYLVTRRGAASRGADYLHRTFIAPFLAWQRRRAEYVALDSLSDDILEDIGLTRAGIRDFVDGIAPTAGREAWDYPRLRPAPRQRSARAGREISGKAGLTRAA